MKAIFVTVIVFLIAVALFAQSGVPSESNKKDKPKSYVTIPDFNYRLPVVPGKPHPSIGRGIKDTLYSNMPVIRGNGFSSNMPVMVPDSSVHYYLKIKKVEGGFVQVLKR